MAVSKSCANDHEAWFASQKRRMKYGQIEEVLADLTIHQEPPSVEDKDAPVRACLRYLQDRPAQFNYPSRRTNAISTVKLPTPR